jgi:LacI family transcriptional regulator
LDKVRPDAPFVGSVTIMSPADDQPQRRHATLRDVAEAAGVDVSTVSKVLNGGSRIRVRPETRERILQEAERQKYRPNALARSLRYGRTGALGMLFPDLTNPVYAVMMRGAMRRSEQLGYAILLGELREDASTASYEQLLSEHRIDGLVIATSGDARGLVERLSHEAPHVFVNRAQGPGPSVTVDDEQAGRLAADALIAAGHSRLAFLGSSDDIDTARRRRLGFANACRDAGVAEPTDMVVPYTRKAGLTAVTELLSRRDRPTGVFASSLLLAIGALAGVRLAGKTVPSDLSIVTLDAEDAAYANPPLTAIQLPLSEMGGAAVEAIDRVLKGDGVSDIVVGIAPRLIERESIGPPPAVRSD